MIEYIDIINAIKKCEGSLVTFMIDYNNCNIDFLKILTQELQKNYKIEYDRYDIENITNKTVVFIDKLKIPNVNNQIGSRSRFIDKFIEKLSFNNNVILILISHINMSITPNGLYGGRETYLSNLIFTLKDQKLTIVKSRFQNIHHTYSLDISNFSRYIRKIKLKTIIKNN